MNRVADEKGFTFLTSLFEMMLLMMFLPLIVLFYIFMRRLFRRSGSPGSGMVFVCRGIAKLFVRRRVACDHQ